MKTKQIICLLMFILLSCKGFAQEQVNDSVFIKTRILSTSLFSYIPNQYNSGKANISYEFTTRKHNSLKLSAAYAYSYGLPNTSYFQIKAEKCTGLGIELERKHYLKRKNIIKPLVFIFWPQLLQFHAEENSISGYYFSTSIASSYQQIGMQDDFVDYVNDDPYPNAIHYTTEHYDVNRMSNSLNLKLGYNCIKTTGIVVDFAAGLGVQHISSSNNLNDRFTPNKINETVNFNKRDLNNGSGFYPSFSYQLNIGFCL